MDMNIILHDPVITDLFVEFIDRCNYLRNKRNNIDHVENLQINTKIPRDDVENDIDLTLREDIPVNHHSINFKEIFDLSDKCISQQTFDDVYHQINNLDNLKMSNINNILRLE